MEELKQRLEAAEQLLADAFDIMQNHRAAALRVQPIETWLYSYGDYLEQLPAKELVVNIVPQSVDLVKEFHDTFNHPIADSPTLPDAKTLSFRNDFIREELNELVEAVGAGNIVEVADALGDIQYVLDGYFLNTGLHTYKDAIIREIHRSNMSKLCWSEDDAKETVKVRALEFPEYEVDYKQVKDYWVVLDMNSGKILKSVKYSMPDLSSVLIP